MILYHMSQGLLINCGLDTITASYGRDADDHGVGSYYIADDKVI